ncbi:MAG: hypothetical protein P4L28_01835 [Paludibacteraceae bacterium]|nr:hypothetical protein [Paludibacteraceae bacterium]
MKFLASILCLYVFVLVVLPCHDHAQNGASNQTELSAQTTQACDADQCSPFCTCNCCSTPVIASVVGIYLPAVTFFGKTIFASYNEHISSPYTSIWEPPKLS